MTDNDIIHLIKDDDQKVITHVYVKYHDEFIRFVRKSYPQVSIENAKDAYSDSFHALCRNIKTGKLVSLTCDLKTYIFQIGKYKIVDEINRKSKSVENELIQYLPSDEMLELDYFEEKDNLIKKTRLLDEVVAMLTYPCDTILKLFWFEQKRDAEIVEIMKYTSTDTVKNQRSRCMKYLKEKYLTKLVEEKMITISEKKRLIGK